MIEREESSEGEVALWVAPAGSGPCRGWSPEAQEAPGLTKYGTLHTERWALDLLTPGMCGGGRDLGFQNVSEKASPTNGLPSSVASP